MPIYVFKGRETHVLAFDYGIDPRPTLCYERHVISGDLKWCMIGKNDLNTAILIKYHSDELEPL